MTTKPLLLIGFVLVASISGQAEQNVHEYIADQVLNNLENASAFDSLSSQEMETLSNAIHGMVAKELASMNLSDGIHDPFLLDTIKSIGKKGLDLVKKGVGAIGSVAKAIKSKASQIVKTLGPVVKGLAGKMLPILGPLADTLAITYGVPPGLISGIIGMLTPKEQQNKKLVEKHVQEQLAAAAE